MSMTMFEAIIQFCGYISQTFPILFLIIASVPESCWKKPMSYIWKRFTIINVTMGIVFVGVLYFICRDMTNVSVIQMIANTVVLAAVIIVFIEYSRFTKLNAVIKAFLVVMNIHYAAMVVAVNAFICTYYLKVRLIQWEMVWPYQVWNLIGVLCIYLVTIPLIYFFIKKKVIPVIPLMEKDMASNGLVVTSIALCVFCVCAFIFNVTCLNSILSLFMAGLLVSDLIVYYFFFSQIRIMKRQEEIKHQDRLSQMRYQNLIQNMEETRRIRHDMRHHLNTISVLLKEEKYEEMSEYLEANQTIYDALDMEVYSKNLMIDSVLKYYINKAKRLHIDVRSRIEVGDVDIDKTDLVVILGNCIENAIQACEETDNHPEIEIKMSVVQQMLLIQVKNTCVDTSRVSDEFVSYKAFPSTKGGGEGLKSIHISAHKYGGSALFRQSKGYFTARIMLKIKN
ncbi:sensor histidine kinase [Frisingicoccus sp.]|uniref:sensor histidine kinase n=1 Tax=Frisingicoccus sp. TaxID=1918627 RepID=UPI003AB3BFA4